MKSQISALLTASVLLAIAAQHTAAESLEAESAQRDLQQAHQVLNTFHQAAADADFDTYFAQFSSNAVFLGTDASERWSVDEFRLYAKPHFEKERGWVYLSQERHIVINGDFAWFDELLDSKSYGESRGSGVLVKVEGRWKIAQYNLHFPIPNALANEITDKIKLFQAQR